MKVERMMEIETNDIRIGDQIHVGKYTATCQEITPIVAIFLLDQYITGYGYLREALQSEEVLNDFAVTTWFHLKTEACSRSHMAADGTTQRVPGFLIAAQA